MPNATAQQWLRDFYSQNPTINERPLNFYEIQKAFETYEKNNLNLEKYIDDEIDSEENGNKFPGWMQFKRWENFMEARVYPSGDISLPSRNWEFFKSYLNSNYADKKFRFGWNTKSLTFTGNWSLLGPLSTPSGNNGVGRINFVRFDPSNTNTIYVCAPTGGLWKSTDGGATWNTYTDSLPVIGCSDLLIDPTNTNIMYLATGDYDGSSANTIGVLKSSDGGITWDTTGFTYPVSQGMRISKMVMNPYNSNTILMSTKYGIWKTTDGATTWTQTAVLGNCSGIIYHPLDTSVVYAVSQSLVSNTCFFKSVDGGQTFTYITSGLPASTDPDRLAIGVSPDNPSYVYVLASSYASCSGGNAALFRSTDEGDNFTFQSCLPDNVGNQGWYDLAIAVNPFDANDVYAGGIHQNRSVDGGLTWAPVTASHADVHSIEFLPGSSTTIFSCNDGGIFKSTDNGASWLHLDQGMAISQLYRMGASESNPGLNLAGLQDNGTNRLSASNWNLVYGGDGMECIIDYTDTSIMYVSIQYGRILKSVNGGASWTGIVNSYQSGVNSQGSWLTPYVMHPTDHNTLLVGKQQIYRSADAGAAWTQVGSISGFTRAIAYAPSNPDYIYVGTSSNFYTSIDGNNFTDRTGTLPVNLARINYIAVSNTDPNKVWVTFSGYSVGNKVFASVDAGVTWTNYSAGLPNLPVNCIVYQNGSVDGLYVGTDVGVYFIDNTQPSWQPFFTGLPYVIVDELEIVYNIGKIRAATYGRGLWESDLAVSLSTEVTNFAAGDSFTIIPNPSSGRFKISLGNLQLKKINVYDSSGKIIFESENKNAEIDLSSQKSGSYIVEVRTSNKTLTKKVIIQ